MIAIRPVVLCGGSGTRLWPLSTPDRPKQFLPLFGDSTLFELTLRRLPASVLDPIVVTGETHLEHVHQGLKRVGLSPRAILLEPEPRNTAPAVVAAAVVADPDDILALLPSDHLISDIEAFSAALSQASAAAESGSIAALGVTPDSPVTGYGYIRSGRSERQPFPVVEFVEKPSREIAQTLIDQGCVWNSGMFVMRASTALDEARLLAPDMVDAVSGSVGSSGQGVIWIGAGFLNSPYISFDHAVMEKTERGVVVELDAGWSDVGSFLTLWENSAKDRGGNVTRGDVALEDVSGSLVFSSTKPVAVAGVDKIVVIETEDGVLVVPREHTQPVMALVERLLDDA